MKFAVGCKCGGAMSGEVKPDERVADLLKAFWQVHNKPECGECPIAEAHKNRREKELDTVIIEGGKGYAEMD